MVANRVSVSGELVPPSEWGSPTSRLSMELQRVDVPLSPPCEVGGETNGDVASLPINCDQKGTTSVSKLLASASRTKVIRKAC